MRFIDRNFTAGIVVLGSLAMTYQLVCIYVEWPEYYNHGDSTKHWGYVWFVVYL